MENTLIGIGFLFIFLGYLVAIKKMTWLLSGYNEKRVKNKNKLAHLVGGTYLLLGTILLIFGIVGFEKIDFLIISSVVIILIELVYVNIKMVD